MLHVRVASPGSLTASLTDLLAATPGVVNLVVLPGAARRPDGDAVQFDLATGAANPVLGRLRELQASPASPASPASNQALGPLVIEWVDAVVDAAGPAPSATQAVTRPALDGASYHGETAPAWDMVEAKIAAESVYAPSFYLLLALAALIGAVGILTNSSVLLVGAMVVGPEYNATIAVALGLDRRDWRAVRRGLRALVVGFVLAIAATLAFSVIIRNGAHVPRAYQLGIRPISDLINSPDLFSVIVAVLAGIIGVVSLTEARAGALIGVFISVTTIPAASDIGLSLAFQSWRAARGATYQLLLNLGLLIVVGALALAAQRVFWHRRGGAQTTPRLSPPPPSPPTPDT